MVHDPADNDPGVKTQDHTDPDELELWDRATVLRFFGGIHVSTLYRNLGTVYPQPMFVAPNVARWLGHECRDARKQMLAKRNEPKPKPIGRGRKKRRISDDDTTI